MATHRNCAGMTRRDCLQLGLGALAGSGLVDLLRLQARAASPAKRPTNCILIWMDGGPTHFETFDPKPDAPAEIRGELSPIKTKIPGVYFSQHMTRLAGIADKLAIVRSVCHNQGNHGAGNHYMMTGSPPRIPVGCGAFVSFHPSLGSVTAHERSAPEGLPAYFSMPQMSRSGGPNFLGAEYCAVCRGRRSEQGRLPRARRGIARGAHGRSLSRPWRLAKVGRSFPTHRGQSGRRSCRGAR